MSKKNFILFISLYCLSLLLIFLISSYFQKKSTIRHQADQVLSTKSIPSSTSSTFYLPEFSLDSIFSPDHSWVDQLPQEKIITLITTGDIIPARTVNYKMTIYNDFTHPFKKTADLLKSADLTLINLESPLTENCPVTNEGMIFCGNQRFIEGLLFADIDVVNLANNHTLNWGVEGVEQTIDLLESNNIQTCGFLTNNFHPEDDPALRETIKEIKGIKLGFLGWNLLETFDPEEILEIVRQTKKEVDLLIVSLHWGAEYTYYPAEWQKELAHQMIESGADLIVGNHPHCIQPIEVYQNKAIIYAHGNFIFDQEWSQETKTGFVAKTVFYQNKIIDLEVFPIFISDYNQPEFLEGERKQAVLEKLENISRSSF